MSCTSPRPWALVLLAFGSFAHDAKSILAIVKTADSRPWDIVDRDEYTSNRFDDGSLFFVVKANYDIPDETRVFHENNVVNFGGVFRHAQVSHRSDTVSSPVKIKRHYPPFGQNSLPSSTVVTSRLHSKCPTTGSQRNFLKLAIALQEWIFRSFISKMKKAALVLALGASFVTAFPLSMRVADSFFTYPFHKEWHHAALLVWPDHVEARSFDEIAEVSPLPKDAPYTFNVSPDREGWVKEQVRRLPSPNGNASWTIHVQQLGASRQQIRLELMGDGISGLIYEAQPDKIIPLRSRLGGPAGAFVILAANLVLWGGGWLLIWVLSRIIRGRKSPIAASLA